MGKTVEETYKKVNHLNRKPPNSDMKMIYISYFRLTISSMSCYVRTCTWDLSNLSVKTCGFMTLKPTVLSQKVKTDLGAFFKVDLSHFVVTIGF